MSSLLKNQNSKQKKRISRTHAKGVTNSNDNVFTRLQSKAKANLASLSKSKALGSFKPKRPGYFGRKSLLNSTSNFAVNYYEMKKFWSSNNPIEEDLSKATAEIDYDDNHKNQDDIDDHSELFRTYDRRKKLGKK